MSFTVTVKEQELVFPQPSVAVAVTVVVPTGKNDPGAMLKPMVGEEQASEAVAAYETLAPHWPVVLFTVMEPGHVMFGGVMSCTTMVRLQVAVLPQSSVAR